MSVLGWIWIGLGCFFALGSLIGMIAAFAANWYIETQDLSTMPDGTMPGEAIAWWIFRHFKLLSVTEFLFALAIVIAGWNLLQLRSWARTFLETVCWLGLGLMVALGTWWIYVWTTIPRQAQGVEATTPPLGFDALGAVSAVLVILSYGVPAAVLIWLLRHKVVRTAVKPETG